MTLKITMVALNPDDYGLYGYALSLTGLFMAFTELNLSGVYFKRIAEGEDLQQHYSTYVTIRLLLTGGAVVMFLLYSATGYIGFTSIQVKQVLLFVFILIYYFFDTLMLAVMGAYQARREVRRTQLTTTLMAVANLAFIAAFVAPSNDVRLLALSLVCRPLVGIVCFARLLRGELLIFSFTLNREIVRDYLRFITPLLPMSILAVIYDRIDGTLVATFLSYRDNGFLTAATMFNTALLIPSTAVITLLYSSFSEEIRAGNYVRVQELSRRATKYISMLVTPAAIFFYFHAETLVLLAMNSKYLPAVPIVKVFMFQIILLSVSRTFDSILMASERLRLVSTVGISLYLFGIAVNFILIPEQLFGFKMMNLGAVGPAYKSLLFYVVYIGVTGFLLHRIYRITIYWRFVLHTFAAMAAGYMALAIPLHGGVILSLIMSGSVFACLYLLFLVIIRELGRSDLDYFLSALLVWRVPTRLRMPK